MHLASYLRSAEAILKLYDGAVPFASFLKEYFRSNKKFGSRDRREITQLCYCFFRIGTLAQNRTIEEALIFGQFLCSSEGNPYIIEYRPEWVQQLSNTVEGKLKLLGTTGAELFPLSSELTSVINHEQFGQSLLIQPDLFIRIRPGKEQKVITQLTEHQVNYQRIGDDCIRLPNATKVDQLLDIDVDVVIQDLSSQRSLDILFSSVNNEKSWKVWDCCAASGGKSMLMYDHVMNVDLTVSDVRQSIMVNLQKRFARAGIRNYQSFVADVATGNFSLKDRYDIVVCDAPCSGSGTWSRTPEQLQYFSKEKIDHYTSLQKKIAVNASASLKKGGYLLYITCSVFEDENEGVVTYLTQQTDLQLVSSAYSIGYDKKADTLFSALLRL